MPIERTPVPLSQDMLRRRPVATGTPERSTTPSGLERALTRVWEKTLVGSLNHVLTEGTRPPIALVRNPEEFTTESSPIAGMFIDNPPASDNAKTFLTNYQKTHPDSHLYVVAADLPVIRTGAELYTNLNIGENEKAIADAYAREGKPIIHEAGKDATVEKVVTTVQTQLREAGPEAYKTVLNAVERGLPVISDRTTERLLVIASEEELPELNEFSVPIRDILEAQPHQELTTNVVRIEGPQGSGKTGTVSRLRERLVAEGIPTKSPTTENPMRVIKDAENSGAHDGTMLPFSARQDAVKAAMAIRAWQAHAGSKEVAITDRSPDSAALTHLTTSRTSGTPREHGVDALLISDWMQRHEQDFEGLTVALLMEDLYQSFFRLRNDPSADNQGADFTTQFLEHVFYETLVAQGRAIRIEVDNKTREQIVDEVRALPEFNNVLKHVERQSNTREAIKEWWGAEERVGVWFSTRLAKDLPDDEVRRRATELLSQNPDMIFVGAAQGISVDDQERTIRLVQEARTALKQTVHDVKVVDFPSDPSLVTGTGDFSVVMKYLNTDNPAINRERMGHALKRLTHKDAPYIIAGYGLFDNGSHKPPTVASTVKVSAPWPADRGYIAEEDVLVGVQGVDLIYFDRGSGPPAGPLPLKTIEDVLAYCDTATQGNLPPIMIGGGFFHRDSDVLNIPGVTTLALEENPTAIA